MSMSLLLRVLLALGVTASPAWASVGVVQVIGAHDDSHGGVSGNQTFMGTITAGNTVVVAIVDTNSNGTITGCSDGTNGAYTLGANNTTSDAAYIFYLRNVTGAAVTITCVSSGGGEQWHSVALELNGVDNAGTVQSDTADDSSGTSHVCASPGIAGTGFFMGASRLSSGGDITVGTGYEQANDVAGALLEYDIKAGSSETVPFTTSGSTATQCASLFLPEAAAGGGGGGGGHKSRLLMGVG